jgi:pyruvate kinase
MVGFASAARLSKFGERRASARNLLHYLALRRLDLRRVQRRLADLGLSSLGRSEGHTLYNLDAVLSHLRQAEGRSGARVRAASDLTPEEGRRILGRCTRQLLGQPPPERRTRIMVTLPTEAGTDYRLVRDLVAAGMDAARINCAHDDEAQWERMIANVRRAEGAVGRSCRVEMDLEGPKVRTGPLPPRPPVVRWRPHRNDLGVVVAPGRVWLTPAERPVPAPPGTDHEVRVRGEWLTELRVPGTLQLRDARAATRQVRLVRRRLGSVEAEVQKTAYVTDGTVLWGRDRQHRRTATAVGPLPTREGSVRLRVGDRLRVTARPAVGRPRRPPEPSPRAIPEVSCTLPEALAGVRAGHRVWFDDGKIGGVVARVGARGLLVRITHAADGGSRLRSDRGINFPDSPLAVPPLTEADRHHLAFVARHADLVGFSFVRHARDLRELRRALTQSGRPGLGVILKIETRAGFEELPALLLEALRGPPAGVMIARGDLAVEVGYERLAEVQEEILWLCEAAHLPTVWATEVLAGLAKTGLPTRAEVTDAAMGERAECVMLNKGPHVVEAVRVLDNILQRMEAHQDKKSARLRHLAVADRFLR